MPESTVYRVTLPNGVSGDVTWIECEGYEATVFVPAKIGSIIFQAQTGEILDYPVGSSVEPISVSEEDCLVTATLFTTTTTTTAAPTTTTSTTTSPPSTFSLGYDASSALNACADYLGSPSTYFSYSGVSLANSAKLFTNGDLATPASNGYYSDGTNYYIITSDGILNDKATCVSATTTTTTTTTTTAPGTTTTTTAAGTTTTTTTIAPGAFNVTNNGSSNYVINGNSNPTLTVTEGEIYTFNISSVGHPFWIKTVNSTGTVNQYNTGVTNNGTDDGTITWTVSYDAPSTLYYNCQFHSAMAGTINVIDVPTTTTTGAPTTTTTAAGTTTTTTAAGTTTTTTAAGTTTTTTDAGTTTTTTDAGTTTTTTEAPTTTTTTAGPVACKEYQITSTDPVYGADISGTLCDNTPYSDTGFFGTVNLCFQEYTLSVAGGTYSLVGDCAPPTTTTTTTTTAAPTTTTTTAASTLDWDCVLGTCTNVGTGAGIYISYEECIAYGCEGTPTTTTTTAAPTTEAPTTAAPTTTTAAPTTEAPTTTTTTDPGTTAAPTTEAPTTTTTTAAITTTTTTTAAPSYPTVDACGGSANLAIANNATGISVDYITPTDGTNVLAVCTINGSPLSTGTSDSFIGAFASSIYTELSGASGKQLRIWVAGTAMSTTSITSSPFTVYGDNGYGTSLVVLEIID